MATLTRIARVGDPSRVGDVVFMHGLRGDARGSWTNAAGDFWPEWISDDIPDIGVSSLGYEMQASAWQGSANSLFDQASSILARLDAEGIGEKPVCFVAHSMGGLLLKNALEIADSMAPEFKRISEQTRGVIFISTPHTGSDLARLGRYLRFLRLTIAVQELERGAPALRQLDQWYRTNVQRLGIQTKVFYELRATNGMQVVDAVSANPGLPGLLPIGIDADHNTICKPQDKDGLLYKRTRKFVVDLFLGTASVNQDTSGKSDLERRGAAQVRKASALAATDFAFARNAYRSDLYIPRAEEEAALHTLDEGLGILVIGKPLSGKTRLIWQLFRSYPEALIVMPIADQMPPVEFDRSYYAEEDVFILFDDIYHVSESARPLMWCTILLAAGAKSCRLVCSTRDGVEFEQVAKYQPSLVSRLKRIYVSRTSEGGADFPKHDGWLLAQAVGVSKGEFEQRFDGTPGSSMLDLSDMRKRYRRLRNERQGDIPMIRLLDAAKLLHMARQTALRDDLLREVAEHVRGTRPFSDEVWEELRYRTEDEGFGHFSNDEFRVYRPYLERCVEYNPRDRDFEKLMSLLSARNDDEGLLHLGNALAIDQKNRLPLTEVVYREAIEKGNPNALGNLGAWLIHQPGRQNEAESMLRDARDAGDIYAPNNLGYLYARQRRWSEAEQSDREAIARGYLPAYDNLGLLLVQQEGREGEAEQAFRAAADAGWIQAYDHLGTLLAKMPGREVDAEHAFKNAIKEGFFPSYNGLGMTLVEIEGREKEAEEAFRIALSYNDAPLPIHSNLGNALEKQGCDEEAEKEFQIAIEGGYDPAYNNLAMLLVKYPERMDEAEKNFRNALKKRVEIAHFGLGVLLSKQPGKEAEAERELKNAVVLNKRAYIFLADLLARQEGREAEAERAYEVASETGYLGVFLNWAKLLIRQPARKQEGCTLLDNLAQDYPAAAEFYKELCK